MTITYIHEQSLYVNVTNRCSNRCDFCIRTQADGFYADSLWLKREPTREEILDEPEKYRDLIVRLWGVSAHFVDLPTEMQDEIIARLS
jgi:autonomous glycyl radical cofactor GrcA